MPTRGFRLKMLVYTLRNMWQAYSSIFNRIILYHVLWHASVAYTHKNHFTYKFLVVRIVNTGIQNENNYVDILFPFIVPVGNRQCSWVSLCLAFASVFAHLNVFVFSALYVAFIACWNLILVFFFWQKSFTHFYYFFYLSNDATQHTKFLGPHSFVRSHNSILLRTFQTSFIVASFGITLCTGVAHTLLTFNAV